MVYNGQKQYKITGFILAICTLSLVFFTEQVIKPVYWVKSVVKLVLFLSSILIYSRISKQKVSQTIRWKKINDIKPLLRYMLLFFFGTSLLFMAVKGKLDLFGIKENLMNKESLSRENCLFIFLYIILFNSFLEESFFRGFLFCLFDNKQKGAIISALLFSLYHIGIFVTWFSPLIFILCVIGLVGVGMFLQWLCEKYDSIQASYITHACANIAINIVGTLLIFEVIV